MMTWNFVLFENELKGFRIFDLFQALFWSWIGEMGCMGWLVEGLAGLLELNFREGMDGNCRSFP